jgi:hypothetical protein
MLLADAILMRAIISARRHGRTAGDVAAQGENDHG